MEDLLEFRPIPGYEGLYSVNQSNQVKSHDRLVPSRPGVNIMVKGKTLKNHIDPGGHLAVTLHKNGIRWFAGIHILVAMAFYLQKEPHHNVVKHLDNKPYNNVPSNLQWDTQSQNVLDAFNDGLKSNGENHSKSKLTKKNVLDIRSSNLSSLKLGIIYNVSRQSINNIKRGATWSHI